MHGTQKRLRYARARISTAAVLFGTCLVLSACNDDPAPAAPGGGSTDPVGGGGGTPGGTSDAASGDGGAASDDPAREAFVQQLAQAECDRLERCCQRIELPGVADGCATTSEDRLRRGLPRSGTGARFNRRAADACVQQLAALPCSLLKDPTPWPSPCGSVFEGGQLALGDECSSDFECAPSAGSASRCLQRFGGQPDVRRCTRLEVVAVGQPCTTTLEDVEVRCEPDALCGPEGLCVALAEAGQPCLTGPNFGDTCAQGSVCDRLDTGVCIQPTPVGNACTSIEQCEGLSCVQGECREPLFETSGSGVCRLQ